MSDPTMSSSDWETVGSSNRTKRSISDQTTGSNGEAFTTDDGTDGGIQADTNPSRPSEWLPLPADTNRVREIVGKTNFMALLVKPAENGLDAPTVEYQSLVSMDEVRQWLNETTAAAEVPKPDERGSLYFLAYRTDEISNDQYDDFRNICLQGKGGPTRLPPIHRSGLTSLFKYRCPAAMDGAKRENSNDEATPEADSRSLQRLVYDMGIALWLPFITSSYFPQSKTTVLATVNFASSIVECMWLIRCIATPSQDDCNRELREPLLFQHPLSAILLLISSVISNIRAGSTSDGVGHILCKAGFHQYTNMARTDARLIPSHELSRLTSDAVAYSVDLAHDESVLMGLSRMLRYLQDENEDLNRLGYFDSPELQRARVLIDEWSRYTEYESDSLSQFAKGWQNQANVAIQGLQNVVTQKNQDSTLAIAQESRRIAEASWKDTTSVTAITLITMLFLPATFTATLFSTKFFEDTAYNGDANRQATTYLAMTFPLTAVVIFLWYAWVWFRRRRANVILERRQAQEREENEDLESQFESGDSESQVESEDQESQSDSGDLEKSVRNRMMEKMKTFFSSR